MDSGYDLKQEFGVPEHTKETEVDSRIKGVSPMKAYEWEGEEYLIALLETDLFSKMLGFTLEDTTKWLDEIYRSNFSDEQIDSFEYGDGWIVLRKQLED